MHEKIIASLATIPERKESLYKTIDSIINQVDSLNIYLNNYDEIPDFAKHKKINILIGADVGDKGKFYGLHRESGYLFTLDDDLLYPPDYVEKMINKIEQYNRQSFICVHGNILPAQIIKSYYREKKGLHFVKCLLHDTKVDVPGTGTLAFHSSLYKIDLTDFPRRNMADIWLYVIAKRQNIPIVSIARKDEWITECYNPSMQLTICKLGMQDDSYQTKIINQQFLENEI